MDTELVIKVKYGDTLRRFSVLSNGNGPLDLDMAGLQAKIRNLFKLTSDSDITLTYIDEDNDIVTLVDDADLRDAVKQDLNPLRINIFVDSDNVGSGRSTPLSSLPNTRPPYYPRVRPPRGSFVRPPHFNYMSPPPPQPFPPMSQQFAQQQSSHDMSSEASSSNEEAPRQEQLLSKLVQDLASKVASATPDKYRDFVSKFSHDVMANAAAAASSTAPLMCELIETLSKMGTANEGVLPNDQVVSLPRNQNDDLNKSEKCQISDNPKESEVLPNDKNDEHAGNMTGIVSTSDTNVVTSAEVSNVSNNSAVFGRTGFSSLACPKNINLPHQENNGYFNGNRVASCDSFPPPTSAQQKNGSSSGQMGLGHSNCAFSTAVLLRGPASVPVNPQYNDAVSDQRGTSSCQISSGDNMGRTFHQGVVCDGCGVHPITGPRYKSKVKDNYDLCSICFAELGNDTDYTRMDRPMSYRTSRLLKCHRRLGRALVHPHGLRNRGFTSSHRPQLDSRFIEDVNIVDGTLMAPSTRFTKIWRMHNNGALPWPFGTQLIWIGGDQLTVIESIEVELPVQGCQVGMYLNVAIDFTAPESPGQYVSYWRMALPSGEKFGQCVWVLIQVETPQGDALAGSSRSLNLNLPPDSLDPKNQPQLIDMNAEPVDVNISEPASDTANESIKPLVHQFTSNEESANKQSANDVSINSSKTSSSTLPEVPAPEAYPGLRLAPSAPTSAYHDSPVVSSAPTPVTDVQTISGVASNGNELERSRLKELAEMGFTEVDLNREILRVNEYDLDRALDDLCDVAEWDPMLEELKEMGFRDKETNRKLLMKNGGSIKRVVMDLINAEKEKQL